MNPLFTPTIVEDTHLNKSSANSKEVKLKYIDSIRGIAILMVILVHVSQKADKLNDAYILFAYGQMGVQLFFVASAYTLCLSATNRTNESHSLKKYIIRRFFRIAPLYYTGIVLFFIVEGIDQWSLTGQIGWPKDYTFTNVLLNVFFLHGFYKPAILSVVPGGWSIATEVAFYVIFPILFYWANKIYQCQPKRLLLLIILTLQIVIWLAQFLAYRITGFSVTNNNIIYFNIINQLPVFCIAIGYYFLDKDNIFTNHWLFDILIFISLTSVAFYAWHLNKSFLFAVIPSISALSFIF